MEFFTLYDMLRSCTRDDMQHVLRLLARIEVRAKLEAFEEALDIVTSLDPGRARKALEKVISELESRLSYVDDPYVESVKSAFSEKAEKS